MVRRLVIKQPSGDAQEIPLDENEPLRIGSGTANTIVVRKPGVADQQCTVVLIQGRATMVSITPSSPTLLNNKPVDRTELSHGDVIRIGPIELVYHETTSTVLTPAPVSGSGPMTKPEPPEQEQFAGKIRPPFGAKTQRRPWWLRPVAIGACAAVVLIVAGGIYVLSNAERYRITRHRRSVETAFDEGRFALTRQLADEFLREFPGADGCQYVAETASAAAILSKLATFSGTGVQEIQQAIQQHLAQYPDAEHAETLLQDACDRYIRLAYTLAERGEETQANVARAENLLTIAQRMAADSVGGALDQAAVVAIRTKIREQAETVRFQEALTELGVARDAAIQEGCYHEFFARLQQLRVLWPARELPASFAEDIARLRTAERMRASLRDGGRCTKMAHESPFAPFQRRAISISRLIQGRDEPSGHPICLVHGTTLFAVDAGNGLLLWSQLVSHPASWAPLPWEGQGIVVTADGCSGLSAWQATDGQHCWTLRFEATVLGRPTVTSGYLHVLTDDGTIQRISPRGDAAGMYVLDQPFEQPGWFDASGEWVGVGAAGTMFRLDLEAGKCVSVAYGMCGARESPAPPILVGGYTLAVNRTPSHTTVLSALTFDGTITHTHTMSLPGWVHRPPLVANAICAIPTDRGEVHLFGVNSVDAEEGVFAVGAVSLPGAQFSPVLAGLEVSFQTARFTAITDHVTTVTYDMMTQETILDDAPADQVAELRGRCVQAIENDDELILVTAPPASAGVVVTCLSGANEFETHWQILLGERWQWFPLAESDEFSIVGERGLVVALPQEAFEVEPTEPVQLSAVPPAFQAFAHSKVFDWSAEQQRAYLYADSPSARLAAWEWRGAWRPLWVTGLPVGVSGAPVRCGEFVLVTLDSGKHAFFNADTGQQQTLWMESPSGMSDASLEHTVGPLRLAPERWVVGRGCEIYVIDAASASPVLERHTASTAIGLGAPITSMLRTSEHVYILDASGQLIVCDAGTLAAVGRLRLDPDCRLCIDSHTESIITYSPLGIVTCFEGTEQRWRWVPPCDITLIAEPVASEGVVVVTTSEGPVCVLDARSGRLLEWHDVPIAWSTPVRPTATHLVGMSRNGELWSCRRVETPQETGGAERAEE
ncbi:MAG: PQQ-binding-like beta-propeller repeat protein [Phycisphaerae bacterium]|nr:PQQ-binding-like beta-propeller repeat protein [Phycisphaerae bacterium]